MINMASLLGAIVTTAGRIMFNDILREGMPFYNCTLGKAGCSRVVDDTYARLGRPATLQLLDDIKEIGFKASTISGLSIGRQGFEGARTWLEEVTNNTYYKAGYRWIVVPKRISLELRQGPPRKIHRNVRG